MKMNFTFMFVAVAGLAGPAAARAGNDGFFVTYTHHIDSGETEAMVMTDLTRPAERTDEVGDYVSQMLELEHARGRWASELMLEGHLDLTHGAGRFTGFRWENRYRLFKDENRGLNPVFYAEYEDLDPATRFKMELSGREDGRGEPLGLEGRRERILETRLVLSRDVGPYTLAVNWINETDLRRGGFGFTAFGYAAGAMRRVGTPARGECDEQAEHIEHAPHAGHGGHGSWWKPHAVGVELYGGLGNSRAFGGPLAVQQHYAQPAVMFHLAPKVMLHMGLAIGLTRSSDTLLRTAVGVEF